ncbi:tannase/feruloyl esterase family alpha/beta hydrolase [Aquincola sp. S2]|uniref:Tannase/feruloyl esterase family alpha/beta hydrolase n=1 Tax=Pseudaquabacterium terrae TaxID=2732868 RepID=A0ABX2EPZ8_9BURK|nr:tannase/feruloyl esterase family alpha/beta hydrolase [Aquabacterium terrae]NRF70615.1 tannase/feruloyl esterase family alpha/beta hydrolase [Aquabacterium terrae]
MPFEAPCDQPVRRRHRTTLPAIAATLLAAATGPAVAVNSNPFSFARSAESSVNYTATPFVAAVDCSVMTRRTPGGIDLAARLVPATVTAPEHCRIQGVIPAEISFEINLPTKWNGRVWMFGNGGFAGEGHDGSLEAPTRELGLSKGFATVRQNTGHDAAKEPLATFAHRRPDKLIDHAYRAVHETIVLAKQLAGEFYSRAPSRAYWDGCSTGGRQGMMSAYRYPQDFDGILAAAPTLRWGDVMMKGLSNQLALDAAPTLTLPKYNVLFKHILAKCDAKDGVKDGLVSEPLACNFDPAQDLPRCTGAVTDECFTPAEIASIDRIHRGPRIKGRETFPQPWGIEANDPRATTWTATVPWLFVPRGANALSGMGESFMKYLAFFPLQDPDYAWKSFNFDRDPDRMAVINEILNPKPDLAAYFARKGKILTFWGLADGALNPVMGTDHYAAVADKLGAKATQDAWRMFLVPGVAHCWGGYGPHQIDAMTPLIEWVEGGQAPDRLAAKLVENGVTKYNRSYCAFPKRTVHTGGDSENPANWRCEESDASAELEAGGCSVSADGRDASLPLLLLGAFFGLWRARRRR